MPDLNYCMSDLNYCGITAKLLQNYCGITAELLSNRLNYCMPEKIHRELENFGTKGIFWLTMMFYISGMVDSIISVVFTK